MNFISNKVFHSRIVRTDSHVVKRTSASTTAKNREENGGISRIKHDQANLNAASRASTSFRLNPTVTSKKQNSTEIENNSNVIVAITEGRGHAQCEIGIATMNIESPKIILSQFTDGFSYYGIITKLGILNPKEIIIPMTMYDNTNSKLVTSIREQLKDVQITPVPRRHFSVENGSMFMKNYCAAEFQNSLKFIEMKYYALAALSGLLLYLECVLQLNFIKGSLKFEYETQFSRMAIDHYSSYRLELLSPLCETDEKRSCLFGVLDHTITSIGRRFLRARILEPFCDISNILAMQQCVQELIANPELLSGLEENLNHFKNVDKILKICITPSKIDHIKSVEILLNQILLLKAILEGVPNFGELIKSCKHESLRKFYNVFSDSRLSVILMQINDIIRPEAQYSNGPTQSFQRIQAIHSGVHEYLDLIRNVYTNLVNSIRSTIHELSVKYDLPFRMNYNTAKRFHIQLALPKNQPHADIPSEMSIIYKKGNYIFLTNSEIVRLNIRMDEVVKEIHKISDTIMRKLIDEILQYVDIHYTLVEAIAQLDIIYSLAKVSLTNSYCCPKFGEETRIINATHPLLEFIQNGSVQIGNNILGTPEYNMFIITGPNMGGKTVYIKTIAILQIMAQMGCYVPATSATFRICNRIFTRIGFEDNIEQNASSFQIEIRELEYIFKNITPNSLVIVDEICRSTNVEEGKELSWKFCKKFAKIIGPKNDNNNLIAKKNKGNPNKKCLKLSDITAPFIYITTHFLHLTKLENEHFNVANLYLAAEESVVDGNVSLTYTHKVMFGVNPIQGYGCSLAQCAGFPEEIIPRAQALQRAILSKQKSHNDKLNKPATFLIHQLRNAENSLIEHNISDNLMKKVNLTYSNVANFINSSTLLSTTGAAAIIPDITTNNNITNESMDTGEFIREIERQLYDLYITIITYHRDKANYSSVESSYKNDIFEHIENFLKQIPNEILAIIFGISNSDIHRRRGQRECQDYFVEVNQSRGEGSKSKDISAISQYRGDENGNLSNVSLPNIPQNYNDFFVNQRFGNSFHTPRPKSNQTK